MAEQSTKIQAELILRSIFPVMKVLIADDPKVTKAFTGVDAVVQVGAREEGEDYFGAYLVFDSSQEPEACLQVRQGEYLTDAKNNPEGKKPTVNFEFKKIEDMCGMFTGKMNGAIIGAIVKTIFHGHAGLFLKVVINLFLGLTKMLPTFEPKNDADKKMKLKLSLYMVTSALSVYNKLADKYDDKQIQEYHQWMMQPKRVYQFITGDPENPDVACYVMCQAGQSKCGRGVYERRRPFVTFQFSDIDGALQVVGGKVPFVQCAEKGYITMIGSPEYSANLNDYMARIQAILL